MSVKSAYPDGVCPDCGETIPEDAPEGWACPNCGHACFSQPPEPEAECPNCHVGTVGLEGGRLVCRGECGTDFGPQVADPDADEFKCERCNRVFDIEDSCKTDGKLLCPACAGQEPSWVDRHSVNCYFCHVLFDEREGIPADKWNGNDGGTACPRCVAEREQPEEPCRTTCYCGKCGELKTDAVEFLNIEEDFEGRDVMTFKCPTCGQERKSLVVKRR